MLTGEERRIEIREEIRQAKQPVAAKKLAKKYEVSRQVIVQDIALIRAAGNDIIATNRGYLFNEASAISRVFSVSHADEEIEEELNLIVDAGGKIVNVMVEHQIYGKIEAELQISSRKQVQDFMESIQSGKSSPLKNVTSNYHAHLVEADSENTLNTIEAMLREKGYLVEK